MEEQTNNPADPYFGTLKRLALELKCRPEWADQAYKDLQNMDLSEAPGNRQMYREFLLGIHNKKNLYPKAQDPALLHIASHHFDQVFVIARETESDIRNPRYPFEAAHTHGKLSDYSPSAVEKQKHLRTAGEYVKQGLELFETNKDLTWLADSLQKKQRAVEFEDMDR